MPASLLSNRYIGRKASKIPAITINPINPFECIKRKSMSVLNIGSNNPPRVVISMARNKDISRSDLESVGYKYFDLDDKWGIGDQACDYLYVGKNKIDFKLPGTIRLIQDYDCWEHSMASISSPLMCLEDYLESTTDQSFVKFLSINSKDLNQRVINKIKIDSSVVLLISTDSSCALQDQRRLFMRLINNSCFAPVIIKRFYDINSYDLLQLYASTDIGGLFIDGLGDGLFVDVDAKYNIDRINALSFGILQASRARISKTEYISCPSCGRTLFDLQETTAKIRSRTDHLKGIKIGVMGCIVNGPGEMADADYGYVGTGRGLISLYKGQEVMKSNIPSSNAVDELISLINDHGDWIDPVSV